MRDFKTENKLLHDKEGFCGVEEAHAVIVVHLHLSPLVMATSDCAIAVDPFFEVMIYSAIYVIDMK